MKLIMCLGPICSGKTTWSLDYVRKDPESMRFCFDEFYYMCYGTGMTDSNDISGLAMSTIYSMLSRSETTIIDGFPLDYNNIYSILRIAKESELKLFDVSFQESVMRNTRRKRAGGHYVKPTEIKIYMDLYSEFIKSDRFNKFNEVATIIVDDFSSVNAEFLM